MDENKEFIKDETRLISLVKLLLKKKQLLLKTEIVELCFLIDHQAANEHKDLPQGFTTINYKKYFYGPYSEAFDIIFNKIKDKEIGLKKISNGTTHFFYELIDKSQPEEKILEDEQIRKITDKVISLTENLSTSQIRSQIYNLECFKKTNLLDKIELRDLKA